MGNRHIKRRLAGLNIVRDVTVQVRLRIRKGNKSYSYGRKVLAASRHMSKELSVSRYEEAVQLQDPCS